MKILHIFDMHVSLGSLKVFDAAARLGSFKAAAEELNLSQSAVSHAIAKLEQDVSALLFDRAGRQLLLTATGRSLHGYVGEAFTQIRLGLSELSSNQAQVLRLHSAPSFAAQWLTPRLSRFFKAHPGMRVQIAASTDYTSFAADDFDADIVYRAPRGENLVVHALGEESVEPMCAPELAAAIRSPRDLYGQTLIRSALKTISWEDWFKLNDLPPPGTPTTLFDRSLMAITAAADGLGVCLDSTRLAERELASGRLVRPLAAVSKSPTESDHYLTYPRRNADRPIVIAFTTWLLSELAL